MRNISLIYNLILTGILVVMCGSADLQLTNPKVCTVTQTTNGARISCPDGSTATVSNGKEGPQGVPGEDGEKGDTGPAGEPGKPGEDGATCSVLATATGAVIQCPNGTTVPITNGTPGAPGKDGAAGTPGVNGTNGKDGKSWECKPIN